MLLGRLDSSNAVHVWHPSSQIMIHCYDINSPEGRLWRVWVRFFLETTHQTSLLVFSDEYDLMLCMYVMNQLF